MTTPTDKKIVPLINCPLCEKQPCRHSDSFCTDEDYLTDLDDYRADINLWDKLWIYHYHPSEGENLGLDVTKHQDKLDRCKRIADKREQIQAEMDANTLRFFRSLGYSG